MTAEFVVPPALEPGDEVAVVAPSGGDATSAPEVLDLDFGHTNPAVPIPIGGRVVVDPADERIVFE